MTKKILHICQASPIISQFIEFMNERFDLSAHEFRVFGEHARCPVNQVNNVYEPSTTRLGRARSYFGLILSMCSAKKIILHGLSQRVVRILWAMPWLLKKCYWVMWGGDLYSYKFEDRNWSWILREFFRRSVVRNMGFLVTGTFGDVELARKWYGAKGKYIRCFNYPSNIYKPHYALEKKHSAINIQIGNSADPTNNHVDIFEKLEVFKNEDIRIFVPLSYGDKEYAAKIVARGKEVFGDKFIPLTEFMPLKEYLNFLVEIDIAVFNHRRQQAFGNIITLLGLGKKVYINSESTLNGVFQDFGIIIYDVIDLDIELLGNKARFSNIEKVKDRFSEESLVQSLKKWIE